MNGYQELIKAATGVSNLIRLNALEEVMRGANNGVLDHLERRAFMREARKADKWLRKQEGDDPMGAHWGRNE